MSVTWRIIITVFLVGSAGWASWKTLQAHGWRVLFRSAFADLETAERALEVACAERDALRATTHDFAADVAKMSREWAEIREDLESFDPTRKQVVHMEIESIGMCYCVPAALYEPMLERLRAT